MSLSEVKKFVLSRIKPAPEEEERINRFISELLRTAEVVSKAKPIIVGSLGRGTWLKGDHDIDLFLMFEKGVSRDGLEKMGMENAKEIVSQLKGKYEIKYAEHPYLRAFINGLKVDIVPCYKIGIDEKIISAVDRSPLHVEYALKMLNPKMRDEVRILKQFCKGIGIYGSDAKNLGVSGYICELLIIKYGTFENVLKAVSKMEAGEIIDIENHWNSKDREETRKHLKKMFKNHPLIVIDPVDSERNVSAVLSSENFMKFSKKSREFTKRPAKNFFYPEPKPMSPKEFRMLQERKTKFFSVCFRKPDVIDDIIYPQIRKTLERLSNLLTSCEFEILRKFYFVEEKSKKVSIVFELECWELPFISSMRGPPVFDAKNSRNFLKKYSNPLFGPFVEGDKWVIDKKRDFKTAGALTKSFLNNSPKKLHESGIPEHISKVIFKSRIIEHEEFWKMARSDKKFSSFMREKYFEKY